MSEQSWEAFALISTVVQGPQPYMDIVGYIYTQDNSWKPMGIDYSNLEQACGQHYFATPGNDGRNWKKSLIQFRRPGAVKTLYEFDDDSRWTITQQDPNALPNEVRPD